MKNTPDYLLLTFDFWIQHVMKKRPQTVQDLHGNFMTPMEFNPIDWKPSRLDVVPELLGHRKRENGIVNPMALKHRESLPIGEASQPFLLGNECSREQG